MKIGVVSDTHKDMMALRCAINAAGAVDAWFHLGDGAGDILTIKDELGVPVYVVRGNCDYDSKEPDKLTVSLGGKKFFLTHGHRYSVNTDLRILEYAAMQEGCDMALYGHTHIPDTMYGRVYMLNPGSAARPFYGNPPTCALITVDDGKIRMSIIDISKANRTEGQSV